MNNYFLSSISLLLNCIFLAVSLLWLSKRGGLSYLKGKLPFLNPPESSEVPYYSPAYFHRLDQLDRLPGGDRPIVFLGDSLTHEGEWEEWLNLPIHNRGISGDTTYGILQRLNSVLAANPQKIFILIGVNDIVKGVNSQKIIQNYTQILSQIHQSHPETQVFVESLLPTRKILENRQINPVIQETNQKLEILAEQFSYPYINLWSAFLSDQGDLAPQYSLDGLHLNGLGYDRWQQILKQYL